MSHLLIEPHYLGSLEYFTILLQSKKVTLEVCQHFTKQTYKNRCQLLSSGGVLTLSVPVQYTNHTPTSEVKVDYRQSWLKEHQGAFYSAYGKAPYFEFFADEFHAVWERRPKYLLDLNVQMMTICLKVLQHDMDIDTTKSYRKEAESSLWDIRERILAKRPFDQRDYYQPVAYGQLFGNKFVPNLSIIDLLMCEGQNAVNILLKSTSREDEQIH